MKALIRFNPLALAAAVAVVVAALAAAAPPPVPSTPATADKLVYAQPVILEEAFEFEWRAEKPEVSAGYIIVLEVDPDMVYPRQTYQPVLYVDGQTVMRINVGYVSGRVVGFVPSDLKEDGTFELDLSKARIFFGSPALPEQVDAAAIEQEKASARAASIQTRPQQEVSEAMEKGGEVVTLKDRRAIYREAARLIQEYAPDESELAESLES
jgi:hypothetical protein